VNESPIYVMYKARACQWEPVPSSSTHCNTRYYM